MSYTPPNPNGQATMANSSPVVLASDQASVPVASTLTAETTKVIGVTRTADGSGNLLTSTTNALDVNLKTSSITLPVSLATNTPTLQSGSTTAVTQPTAANLNATVVQATGSNLHVVVDTAPSTAVTNAGTFAVQATPVTQADTFMLGGVNIKEINGITPLMGAGNGGTGSLRVNIASDQLVIPVSDNSGSLTVDAPVGTPVFATLTPSTTGGWSVDSRTALTNTAVAIKASAGTFGGYMFYNPNASAVYIQVWDLGTGSITVGTTAPTYVIPIPATSAANVEFANGLKHTTAISYAATTTATGSSAPASALTGFALFK